MQSSSAARAWPHFVPRLELDAELKAIDERIRDACKRLDEAEAQDTRLHGRLDEHKSDQSEEVAKRLADTEERVANEVAALRLELRRGLEDVRAATGTEAAVRDRMAAAHEARFDGLAGDVAALTRQCKHLELEVRAVPDKHATKADVKDAHENSLQSSAEMFRELKEELARLELSRPNHQVVRDLHDELHSKHEELKLNVALTASGVDGLKKSMAALERRQGDVDANRQAFETLAGGHADLGRQVRSAREEQKVLRSQVSQEHEVLRRTVFSFQDSARELRASMELLSTLDGCRQEAAQRCEQLEKDVSALAVREMTHWEASQDALDARKKEHGNLEVLVGSLRQDLSKHVEVSQERTEQLRQHNVSLCFAQMDKAMGIHKSLMQVEKGHRELQEAVKCVHLPKV